MTNQSVMLRKISNETLVKKHLVHVDSQSNVTGEIKALVSSLGISIDFVEARDNVSLLRTTDESKYMSHYNSLKNVSVMLLSVAKSRWKKNMLSVTKMLLQLLQFLLSVEKNLSIPVSSLDTIFVMLKVIHNNHMNTLSMHINKLSENLSRILQNSLTYIKDAHLILETLHSKVLDHQLLSVKLKYFSGLRLHIFYCKLIIHRVSSLVNGLLQLHHFLLEIPSINDVVITRTIHDCSELLNKVSALSNKLEEISTGKILSSVPQLTRSRIKHTFVLLKPWNYRKPTLLVNDCSLNSYITESARYRSKVVAKELANISLVAIRLVLEEDHLTTEEQNNHEMLNNKSISQLSKIKLKRVAKVLTKLCKRTVSKEHRVFTALLQEILDTNTNILHKNPNTLFIEINPQSMSPFQNFQQMRKSVHWYTTIGPIQRDQLHEDYMLMLWLCIRESITERYLELFLKCKNDEPHRLNNPTISMIEQDCLWSAINKLDTDSTTPQRFLEVLSNLAVGTMTSSSFRKLDAGISKTMAIYLKDRFRNFAKNDPGAPVSQTITSVLQNHVLIKEMVETYQKSTGYTECSKIYRHAELQNMVSIPLAAVFNFISHCLHSKRLQFLSTASWEPFFVVCAVDINKILYYTDFLLTALRDLSQTPHFEISLQFSDLHDKLEKWKLFKESSIQMMTDVVKMRSKNVWSQHMPTGKIWRRKGSRVQVYEANTYVNVALQSIFAPIIDSFNCLPNDFAIDVLCKCVSAFVKAWLGHILSKDITFSLFGATQLDFDYVYFLKWFEQDTFPFSAEEISEIHSLPVVSDMRSCIILLSCQPQARKNSGDASLNSVAVSSLGSSASAISQVSIDSYNDNDFDDIINGIHVSEKERWLGLRAKGGNSKRNFLCVK